MTRQGFKNVGLQRLRFSVNHGGGPSDSSQNDGDCSNGWIRGVGDQDQTFSCSSDKITRNDAELGGHSSQCNDSIPLDFAMKAVVYDTKQLRLISYEALAIVEKADKKRFSPRCPWRPNGGDMFIYATEMIDDHIGDGYRWCSNTGFCPLPTKANCLILRKAQNVSTATGWKRGDKRFIKYSYKLPHQRDSPLLIHYVGDSSVYKPFPHGNAVVNAEQDYYRTVLHIGQEAKANLEEPPQRLYENLLCDPKANLQPAYQPRNRKQIENFQRNERQKNSISHDSLFAVYSLGFEFPDFVNEYRADFGSQNNLVYLTSQPLLQKLNELLDPPEEASKVVEVLYDTTFELGLFYVSVFSYRHYLLKHTKTGASPTIPAAFLIHQRKFGQDHQSFLSRVGKSCPNLLTKPFAFVSDREFKDVSAVFPKAKHLYCWTHMRKNVREWANKPKRRNGDCQRKGDGTYSDDVFQLLTCRTRVEFDAKVQELTPFWSSQFITYFDKKMKPDMLSKACRWVVEETGLYNKWSGITTNAAESINAVLEREFGAPKAMDEAVLQLLFLSNYFNYEINRGYCNTGTYHLRSQFQMYKKDIQDFSNHDLVPPRLLLKQVKDKLADVAGERSAKNVQVNSMADGDKMSPKKLDDSTDEALKAQKDCDNSNELFTRPLKAKVGRLICRSQIKLAKLLCTQGKVLLVSERSVFIVGGHRNRKYCVSLFPHETCQCGSTATCYHILAARLSIGMTNVQSRGRKNIAMMFQNNRRKVDRLTTVNKQPRPNDYLPGEVNDNDQILSPEAAVEEIPKKLKRKAEGVLFDPPSKQPAPSNLGESVSHTAKTKSFWSTLTSPLREAQPLSVHEHGVYAASLDRDHTEANGDDPLKTVSDPQSSSIVNDTNSKVNQSSAASGDCKPETTRSQSEQKPSSTRQKKQPPVYCVCVKPYEDGMMMADCDGVHSRSCRTWYHQQCVNPPMSLRVFDLDKSKRWTWVASCCLPVVPKWGGKAVTNTCTIDNALTILYLHILQHPGFFDLIPCGPLSDTLDLFMRKRFCDAKTLWAEAIGLPYVQGKMNCYGNEHEKFFDHFQEMWSATAKSVCSGSCAKPTLEIKMDGFCLKRCDAAVGINAMFASGIRSSTKCNKITKTGRKCGEFRMFNNITLPPSCSILPIRFENGCPQSFRDLDEEVTIGDCRFVLAGATFHCGRTNHYTGVIRWYNNHYFYDGLARVKLVPLELCDMRLPDLSTAIYARIF